MSFLVSAADVISLSAVLVSLFIVCRNWRKGPLRSEKFPLLVLLVAALFHNLSNSLEWTRVTGYFDVPEDYAELLNPVLWVFLLYAFLQEEGKTRLQETEERFRQLADNLNAVFWLSDRSKKKMVYVSSGHERIWGLDCESLGGYPEPFINLVHDDDRQSVERAVELRMLGYPSDVQFRIVSPDGAQRWVRSRTFPVTNESGQAYRMAGIAEDITQARTAQQVITDRENLLRTIINGTREAMIAIGEDGLITLFNPAAVKMFGRSEAEMLGGPLDVLMPPEFRDRHLKYVRTYFARGKPDGVIGRIVEVPGVRSNGQVFPMDVSLSVGSANEKRFLVAVLRDVTERKATEGRLLDDQMQLQSLASELTVAEERERRRLARFLHDEVGTLLITSKIKLGTLRKSATDANLATALDQACDSLDKAINHTRTLTFDLSSPILQELGLEAATAEWLSEEIEQKHGIAVEFEDDGTRIPIDDDLASLIFRDLRELLVNVVKHSQADEVAVSMEKSDRRITITVTDNGVGFDPAEASAKRSSKAAFGLFSIRQRLGQIGGSLEIDSAPGRGCRVVMMTPLTGKSLQTGGENGHENSARR